MRPHVLLARLDNAGDVLLTGPAVRAVASGARRITFLAGPRGREAASLLEGVDLVLEHRAPWIDASAPPVDREAELALVERLRALQLDQAILFTSFHQSALPLALLLRFAGVPTIAAISDDYPGSLLDVRHRVPEDIHEVERNLSLVATLGYRLPAGDDGRLRVRASPGKGARAGAPGYVVVHPGASVPARTWTPARFRELVDALATEGHRVVVTGGPDEVSLCTEVMGTPRPGVLSLAGETRLSELAEIVRGACVVVTGNTGPAHLAAAVGTPVVELFAPTVPAVRWRPWGVPHALLGDLDIACRGCRARVCPLPIQACLEGVGVMEVVNAIRRVLSNRDATLPPQVVEVR